MTGAIYLFRHVADLRRGETRNVGVALHAHGKVEALFVGEKEPGEVDGRRTRHIVSDGDAYADWVHYWRHQLDRGQEGIGDLIAPQRQRPDFTVVRQGAIILDEADDPFLTLTGLYKDLVERRGADKDAVTAQVLTAAANDLLREAGVDKRAGFQRRIPVRDPEVPAVTHRFPFGIRNGRLTVGAAVSLESGERIEQLSFRFNHVPKNARRICLVRHGGVEDSRSVYLDQVIDERIDIDDSDAVDKVRAAFA